MTIIAWHGPTKTLAADKMMACGGFPTAVTKIFKRNDGWLMGCTGESDRVSELTQWFLTGAQPDMFPASCRTDSDNRLLVIDNEGKVYLYIRAPVPMEVKEPFFAIGCGCDFALTAMHLGKNAVEAVEITCELDIHCGKGVDSLQLD